MVKAESIAVISGISPPFCESDVFPLIYSLIAVITASLMVFSRVSSLANKAQSGAPVASLGIMVMNYFKSPASPPIFSNTF